MKNINKNLIKTGIITLIVACVFSTGYFAFADIQLQSDTIAGDQTLKLQSNSKGLIGHWDLTEESLKSSTVISDLTPYGNDGTITVGGGGFTTDQKGQAGRAYDFDGADTKIDTGFDMIGVGAISISAWIYPTEMSGGYGSIVNNGKAIFFFYNPTENVFFRSNGSTNSSSSNDSVLLNQWSYVVVTRTDAGAGSIKFYVNGVDKTNSNNGGTPEAGSDMIIGNNDDQTRAFDGSISDVRIYNRALSQPEITQLYEQYNPKIVITCPDFIDGRDGKSYKAVKIGDQCWMQDNLNYGTIINSPTPSAISTACTGHIGDVVNITGTECYCISATYASCQRSGVGGATQKYCYNNTESYCDSDGALYEWQEALDLDAECSHTSCTPATSAQGICPVGWHIPNDTEYKTLEMYLGMTQAQANSSGWRGTTQGDQLKASGLCQGRIPCATSHFDAPLAGSRLVTGAFYHRSSTAYFWSSSQYSATSAWRRYLRVSLSTVYRGTVNKYYGFSVRCIKD